jgi:hypothetical protein
MNSIKVNEYCKNINNWADRWKGFQKDVKLGNRIIEDVFIPFIEHVIDKGLAKRTIKRHIDNLWLLGGEIINRINLDEDLRKLDSKLLVLKFIDDEGGPYSKHNNSDNSIESFDSTCKKLFKFLQEK